MPELEHRELEKRNSAFAFFDLDGTLTQGNTTVFFAKYLFEQNVIGDEAWKKIHEDVKQYEESNKEHTAYRKFAIDILGHFAQSLSGVSVQCVRECAQMFIAEALQGKIDGYKIHDFSRLLVNKISEVSVPVVISGSPREVVEPLTNYLGVEARFTFTTEFLQVEGCYFGGVERNLALDEEKALVLQEIISGGVDQSSSFAFGDSEHDLPLLECVDHSFVLGSNNKLHEVASQRGYSIHVEGDGVLVKVDERIMGILQSKNESNS